MIADETALKEFYETFYAPALKENEGQAFLMALAARNKYRHPDEEYVLGNRAEMLAREYIEKDNYDIFCAKIQRLAANDEAYLDKNYRPVPKHLKVIYAAVNPVDLMSSYCIFTKKLAERNEELLKSRNRPLSAYTVNGLWASSMQTCPSSRRWFDFDLDAKEGGISPENLGAEVSDAVRRVFPEGTFRTVITHGGAHLLVLKEGMSKSFNPVTIMKLLEETAGGSCDEIKLNQNGLIPCPGTIQGGKTVRLL